MTDATEMADRTDTSRKARTIGEGVRPPGTGGAASYLDELDRYWKLAQVLTESGMLPAGLTRPAQALAVMLKGRELGIPPMQAFSQIHVIDGRPVMSGSLMMALCVRDAGCGFTPVRQEEDGAVVRVERPGWQAYEATFTEEDAERAGLTEKRMWQEYPRAMYWWRAVSIACRTLCPDVVGGLYTPEEIADGNEVAVDPKTGGLEETPPVDDAEEPHWDALETRYLGLWEELVEKAEERAYLSSAYQHLHPRLSADRDAWDLTQYAVAIRDLEQHGWRVVERVRDWLRGSEGARKEP